MDAKKITFKKAAKADKKLVREWLEKPHVKEFWDKEIGDNFESLWICYYDKKPYGMITASNASEVKDQPDPFVPWLELEGTTLLIDFTIGDEEWLGKGLGAETLKKFAAEQDPSVKAFLTDPEVKNEKGIHVYEKAGFVKVSTFIRGRGFFQGKPHYLMKLKM